MNNLDVKHMKSIAGVHEQFDFDKDDTEASNDAGFHYVSIRVPDIRCAACALKIEKNVNKMPGVTRCRTSLATKTVVVDFSGVQAESIVDGIAALGFTPTVGGEDQAQEALQIEARGMLSRLGVAGIGMMQVMMFAFVTYFAGQNGIEPAYEKLMHWASLAMATPVAIYSATPFHKGAWADIKNGTLGMDVPVSLAIIAAFSVSLFNVLSQQSPVYFDSVCMFTFLLLIGRYIELASRRKYQDGINLNARCVPDVALVIKDFPLFDVKQAVPVTELCIGDYVYVPIGALITADGIVKLGVSSVSEMAFTGESLPLTKSPGSRVLAGSENISEDLIIEVTSRFDQFVIKKMADLYTESTLYKPKFSIFADRIAQYFITGILSIAFITGGFWYFSGVTDWFVIALTVLVVSCPCALSLATPVAYAVAVSALRKFGVVVSTGEFIETLASTNHIVFDKTGTLTKGHLKIEKVELLADTKMLRDQILSICAALEKVSRHPIAHAFSCEQNLVVTNKLNVTGKGVEGSIAGIDYRLGKPEFAISNKLSRPDANGIWVLLAAEKPLAWINLSDAVDESTPAVLAKLQSNFSVSMLTGDTEVEAARVANILNIQDYQAESTPKDKVDRVRNLQAQNKHVLMLGDGVNDAAAMGIAQTSLAVSPVDIVVQEAAGATLLRKDLTQLPSLLKYSKHVRSVIRQNVAWALAYNLLVIPLAVSGSLQPWMAALGMSISSLLVVLNANRLRWIGEL